MANNPQNDFKKEIEKELARSWAKQKLIDIKLKLGGQISAQTEINGLLGKKQKTNNREQGTTSAVAGNESGESQSDASAPNIDNNKGGQKKSGQQGIKDNQPSEK